MAKRKKLAIIDGKSVFYRGYYAMPNLSTKDGTPTGGVYGFAVMALEVIRKLRPDYVCVAWDKPKTNIRKRKEIYPDYKKGRKPAPDDFYVQIPLLHELLEAFGWPLYELDDYEADDIMGALSVQARKKDIDTSLITSDLDLLQVINGNVHVYALKKGLSNIQLYDPKAFEEKYGIGVEQFLDFKALKGDSSDNIPGVPGIGEKTAAELISKYKTLDNVFDNVDLMPEKTAKKLRAGKDLAYVSKKIARIWTDAPIKLKLEDIDGSKSDAQKIAGVLKKFEFRTLARQVPDVLGVDIADHHEDNGNLSKFSKVKLIGSDDAMKSLDVKKTTAVFVDSYSLKAHGRSPKWIFFGAGGNHTYAIDAQKVSEKAIANFFSGRQIIGFDVKKTLQVLIDRGLRQLPVVNHDVLITSFLINSLRRERTLHDVASSDISYEGRDFDELSPEDALSRSAEIISIIEALYKKQIKELKALPKISKLAREVEWPILPVLARMEYIGIALDVEYINEFAGELKDKISDTEQQIYGHANEQFNIASTQQLGHILFDKLKLPLAGIKKGKTGYSTAANELMKLQDKHPIIPLIMQYREITKLMNTYVEALPKLVDAGNRLHTTFSLTIAQTGRLSSADPNLQNIPVRTELGKHIRAGFKAPKGKLLIGADYSQFELRMAAVLARDKNMIDMFNRDVDVHTATASQVYGRDPQDVTKNMRRDAKVINFGVLYGMSPHGLSVATGMSQHAAKDFIDKYFELRKPILDYTNKLRKQAKDQGYVETLFGRRRPTPDVKSSNFMVRTAAERAAVNMPFQGSCADLMKMAMIAADEYLQKIDGADMLLQIHDSVLVECPENKADEVARELKKIMENVHKLPVKLTVDTAIGKNWGEL
jgi:DNA polymerase-1